MKDRFITVVSQRLALPLVVVLLGGALWSSAQPGQPDGTRIALGAVPVEQKEPNGPFAEDPQPTTLPELTASEEEFLRKLRGAFGLKEHVGDSPPSPKTDVSSTPRTRALPPTLEQQESNGGASNASEEKQRKGPPELDRPPDDSLAGHEPRLLPADPGGIVGRSRNLELIAREADAHSRRGFELAGRKAYFSARAEFVMALRLVAQALDAEHQTDRHSRALAAGWTAIREADDFLPTGSRLEADLDLVGIIGGHQTPVLKDTLGRGLAPMSALECYFTFAQEQLATAADRELAGSMALYGLGNLHRALAAKQGMRIRAATPKAVVFYQAALLVSPGNYMPSNELGVLLARGGRYEEARIALEHGVSVCRRPTAWYNLAAVYHELGRTELAEQAYRQYQEVYQARATGHRSLLPTSSPQVQWVDPDTFARSYANAPDAEQPRPARPLSSDWNRPAAGRVELIADGAIKGQESIQLCQALGPAAPYNIHGVDCAACDRSRRGGWEQARAIAWQAYAQGEYVGHERTAHVSEYRLRVDDLLDLVYRVTREETSKPYLLNVGDEIRVESFTDKDLDRELMVQPDGTITLRLLGQVRATGRTVAQLRDDLEKLYTEYYPVPAITVTPLKVNTKLEDLRSAVDARYGTGGQSRLATVTPEGTIALPVVGSVQAQGLTLTELQQELNESYREEIEGIEVIPVLVQRAPRFVYVLGEVGSPGRFELTGPTTALQALSMAGSWNVGAYLRQIVVFRRGDDWRLLATMIDLKAALNGNQPCPAGEIWLSDSDVIVVPKSPILRADDFIDLVFTRGIYGVFPMAVSLNFAKLSTL